MSTYQVDIPNFSAKNFAAPSFEHVSLGTGIRSFLTFLALVVYLIFAAILFAAGVPVPVLFILGGIFMVGMSLLISGLRVAAQWEQAVVLRLGQYTGLKGPGMFYIIPGIESARFIDMRVLTLNVPKQSVITKDNVPVEVDGVVFFKVDDARRATIDIQDYRFAVSQYAQNALRDVIGGLSLDEVLSERERVQQEVYEHFQEKVKEWGMHVDSVRILDIQMPEDLKRVMSRQASAEREKRATIIKAEGDKLASVNLAEAAKIMAQNPGAMELRTLQTIDGLGASPSNTVVLFPIGLMDQLKTLTSKLNPTDAPKE